MRITQTILNSAESCLLEASYRLDPPTWGRKVCKASSSIGTGYHAGLELYYRERLDTGNLEPHLPAMIEAAIAAFDRQLEVDHYDGRPVDEFRWDAVEDAEQAHALIVTLLTAHVDGGHLLGPEYRIIGVELNVDHDIGDGIAVKLGADVAAEVRGEVALEDHKTSSKAWDQTKHLPRKNVQASMYTEIARHLWPGREGYRFQFGIMTYPTKTLPARFERRIVTPTPEHGAAAIRRARQLVALVDVAKASGIELPGATSSHLCSAKWCEFFHGCPNGAALEEPAVPMSSLVAAPAAASIAPQPTSPHSPGEAAPALGSLIAAAMASTAGTPLAPEGAASVEEVAPPVAAASAPSAVGVGPLAPAADGDVFNGLTAEPVRGGGFVHRAIDPAGPRLPIPAEGDVATDADILAFQRRFAALDVASKSWIKHHATAGHKANRSFSISVHPSIRRLSIGAALCGLAEQRCDTDEVLARFIAVVIGDDPQPSVPLGVYLGALTIDQAARLAELVASMTTGALGVEFTLDGLPTLTGPALAAAS